ncbi:MAG: hypothetical protein ACLFMU_07175, partial [Bacteroidales bacterium]
METNYEWKKLIRGGTLLLFLFALMIGGPTSTFAQDKAPQVLDLVMVGEGEVEIRHTDGGSSVGTFGTSAEPTIEGGAIFDLFATGDAGYFVESIEFGGTIVDGDDVNNMIDGGTKSTTFTMPNDEGGEVTVTFAKKKVDVDVYIADKEYDGTDIGQVTG